MALWSWDDTYPGTNITDLTNQPNPWPFAVQYTSSAQGSDQMTWQRNFTYELQPIASGAAPYLYEGMSQPTQMTLQGVLLSQSAFQTMLNYYRLERTTTMTDDRGLVRVIFPTELQVTRIPSALFPYKSSFQLTAFAFETTFPS